jgi:FdhD protein
MLNMVENSTKWVPVIKVVDERAASATDALAVEEPLELRIEFGAFGNRKVKSISVTMRTPGNDAELATGFLFTEGIIHHTRDIASVDHCVTGCKEDKGNILSVQLQEAVIPQLQHAERNFYTTSSCGVCGKASINAIRTVADVSQETADQFTVEADKTVSIARHFTKAPGSFRRYGWPCMRRHYSTRPASCCSCVRMSGRHNALDKLIGHAFNNNWLPLSDKILLLSGRASFELVQKAAMAGIRIIAAVGAPSSLAVELAQEFNITLAGFLRNRRFNVYAANHRILFRAITMTACSLKRKN